MFVKQKMNIERLGESRSYSPKRLHFLGRYYKTPLGGGKGGARWGARTYQAVSVPRHHTERDAILLLKTLSCWILLCSVTFYVGKVGTEQSIPLRIGGQITPYKVITSLSSYACKIKSCPNLMTYAHIKTPPLNCLVLLATRVILFFCIGLVSRPPK